MGHQHQSKTKLLRTSLLRRNIHCAHEGGGVTWTVAEQVRARPARRNRDFEL
jgi:hypothetical protein